MADIILSTGDLKQDYSIVDIVYAAQVVRARWVRAGGREFLKFFPEVNAKLKEAAKEKGCDAVIWVDYDINFYAQAAAAVMVGYGTGVRLADTTRPPNS